MVNVSVAVDNGETATLTVDGVVAASVYKSTVSNANLPLSVIVPSGSTYLLTRPVPTVITHWAELR